MKFLLDTNVISEADKDAPSAKVMTWLTQNIAACGVPVVALAERWRGALSAPGKKRPELVRRLEAFEREAADVIIPLDSAAARAWAEYVTSQQFQRHATGYADSLIAAIALSRGLVVVTRNVSDFPGVTTFNPFD